jgi:hypothetical protein
MSKKETIEEASERILANNIDGLRDALQDDDLFFFYKGVIQCYGEAMVEWKAETLYNEEQVYKILQELRLEIKSGVQKWQEDFEFDLDKWFEQHKKK